MLHVYMCTSSGPVKGGARKPEAWTRAVSLCFSVVCIVTCGDLCPQGLDRLSNKERSSAKKAVQKRIEVRYVCDLEETLWCNLTIKPLRGGIGDY